MIYVGDSKGVSDLAEALKKLKKSKLKIVTMDMANAYYTWISENFPKAHIVFDHFHVIKLMNDKLNEVRKRVTAKLDGLQKKQLKGLRFIFLKNHEDLPEDTKTILRNMRGDFQDLENAYMFKDALRTIYTRAKNSCHAEIALHRWCKWGRGNVNSGIKNDGTDYWGELAFGHIGISVTPVWKSSTAKSDGCSSKPTVSEIVNTSS